MQRKELLEVWKLMRLELVIGGLLDIPIFVGLWHFQYLKIFWIFLSLNLIAGISRIIKIMKIEKELGIYDKT